MDRERIGELAGEVLKALDMAKLRNDATMGEMLQANAVAMACLADVAQRKRFAAAYNEVHAEMNEPSVPRLNS